MAYDTEGLFEKAKQIIEKDDTIVFVDDVVCELGVSPSTFYKHFPIDSKEMACIQNLLKKNKKGLAKSEAKLKATEKLSKEYNEIGYVYLINCENTHFYKIGISKIPPYHRMSSLQTGCPFELIFTHISYTVSYKSMEVDLHNKYAKYRHRGEWFKLNIEQVKSVINEMDKTKEQLKLF